MVDYYSSIFEYEELKNLSSKSAIQVFKKIFSRYGVPKILFTDEGTNFKSKEFREFCKSWNFVLKTSSPHNHKSNGKAESAVKQVKKTAEIERKRGGRV